MPRGRKVGFKHSEETKEKMKGKRKKAIEEVESAEEMVSEELPIEVPAV